MQTTRVQRWERKRKRDCVLCARLMRNGFAHITSSSVTFQKNETKKSLTHRVFCFLSRFALKKTFEFLSFFLDFAFCLEALSFPDLFIFYRRHIYLSLFFFFFSERERERERKIEERERQSTKIRERVERQPLSRRFEEKRVGFL